ncbi:MAG: hypothetical protein V1664_04210 [Candidatus Uhrbacteria bacterium]
MSKTPNFDVKIKTVLDSLKPGQIINCPITKKDWRLDEKEIEICRRFQAPPCPIEPQTRMMYLNGFSTGLAIFWKPHFLTGEPLLSGIHPDLPFKVTTVKEFLATDNLQFAQDYKKENSFFDQMWQLETTVPFEAARNSDVDEESIVTACVKTRKSFLACSSWVENSFYALTAINSEDNIDVTNCEKISRSFRIGGSQNISDCAFIFESRSCFDSTFLFDCQECESCFGAVNQRHKKFLWFNEQLDEKEYKIRRATVNLSDRRQADEFWHQFLVLVNQEAVWPAVHGYGNIESKGERLFNCVRCEECFFEHAATDCYCCRFGVRLENSAYASGSAEANNYYLTTGGTYGLNLKFCSACFKSLNSEYCINCNDCEFCFGCVNLKNKKFCVFNKQFSEMEYWLLVDEIKCDMLEKGEYGNFWPAKFSVGGFQYSAGELFIHYSSDQLKQFRAIIVDPAHGQVFAPQIDLSRAREAQEIPDRLVDCQPFVGVSIYDKVAGRHYSVLKDEYEVYKNKKLPFPTEHYATRLLRLLDFSYGPISEERVCASCQKITTTYNNQAFPNRRIYCQGCYLKYLEENN